VALTKEAVTYRERVKDVIGQRFFVSSPIPLGEETVYRFDIILYFPALENPGWFEVWSKDSFYTKDSKDGKRRKGELKHRAGERKAKTRYKEIDYDNRIKFLQDCVSRAVGIPNDCQIFCGYQEKREDPDNPRAEVAISVENPQRFFRKRRTNGSR
jgi:hypothetical protein